MGTLWRFHKRRQVLFGILAFGFLVALVAAGLLVGFALYAPARLQAIPYPDFSLSLLVGIPFKHVVIDDRPPGGSDCCTDVAALGDINGDGHLDVVIGSQAAVADGLVWYAYPEWVRYSIADGDYSTDGKVADLDGDGDADIVISSAAAPLILWYENRGDPTKKENWVEHLLGFGFAHDLVVGDLNGDGRPEVIIKHINEGPLAWFQIPADPTQPWIISEIDFFYGEGLDLGDVDGDGDLDITCSHFWYENLHGDGGAWQKQDISPSWGPDTRTIIADLNADGKNDIVLTRSESRGRLAWFENPSWTEHAVASSSFYGTHSLEVADFDNDGALDIFLAEIHRSWLKQVLIFRNRGRADSWERVTLAMTGSHNARVGDIDGDGDIDIVGKNYAGATRRVDFWQNYTVERQSQPKWEYIAVDQSRPSSQYGKMGLVFTDANHDGNTDIVAGSYLYTNPGGDLHGAWQRNELPNDIDVYFDADVDGDDQADLIGISGTTLTWIESNRLDAGWQTYPAGPVPEGRTQGYIQAQIVAGGKPELVFTRANNLFYVVIPTAEPEQGEWPMVQVSWENTEEGVAASDIDGDGDLDLAAHSTDGHYTLWFENPGDSSGNWAKQRVARSRHWLDRIALADINGDGRPDMVATQETQDRSFNAQIFWLENPVDPKHEAWAKHYVDVLRSANSLDVADMDGDGDLDLIVGEHTDMRRRSIVLDNLTLWYENQDSGARWVPHLIEIGRHSSHLGARVVDLDGEGDLDVVSLGWRQYRQLHLWRNLQLVGAAQ
jgi:hypothetical protein